MKWSFVTLFRDIMECYFSDSILHRAIKEGLLEVEFLSPRDFTQDKHNKVDEYQAGGGAGLVLKPQPLHDTLLSIKRSSKDPYFIFVTPTAKPFRQVDAKRLAKKSHLVLISGRYEGFDERVVEEWADEVFSIGDFILTGGELPSLVICDSVSRNIDGVLGNADSLEGESYENDLLEAPTFTKPNIFRKNGIIKEYLKGNHSKISLLKRRLSIEKTKYFRPDLYKKVKTNLRKNDEK